MADLSVAITLQDRVSGALSRIMGGVLNASNSFMDLDRASSSAETAINSLNGAQINVDTSSAIEQIDALNNSSISDIDANVNVNTAQASNNIKTLDNQLKNADKDTDAIGESAREAFNPNIVQRIANELVGYENKVRQLESELDKANQKIKEHTENTQDAKDKAGELGGAWSKVAGILGTVVSIYGAISFSKNALNAYDVQIEAETKLETIMRKRMRANDEMIQSVKDLCSAQQQIGVIGDEVQLAGAQELATFVETDQALKNLIPAMNNLAVQQNGLNVSSENMRSIGNMVGKVMAGNVSGLSRIGIVFSEAEENLLKYGTEAERSAVLAKILIDNVGDLNKAMAETNSGRIQQMKNDWGDMYEILGGQLYPAVGNLFAIMREHIPQITMLFSGLVTAIGWVATALGGIIDIVGAVVGFFRDNWEILSPLVYGVAIAVGVFVSYLAILHAWTIAVTAVQWLWNTAMAMNPIGLIVMGIALAIGAIIALCNWIASMVEGVNSGVGIVCGVFYAGFAFIHNYVVGIINGLIQLFYNIFVTPIAGLIEFIVNAFNGGFNGISGMFANMLGNLASWLLDFAKLATRILDAIFGSDLTDNLSALQDKLKSMGKNENAVTYTVDMPQLERMDVTDAFDTGAKWGDGLADKIGGLFKGNDDAIDANTDATRRAGESANAINSETAKNTKDTKKSVDISNQNLAYLRDIAERDAINQFTTAEIKVDMTNNNTVNNGLDINAMVKQLSNGVREAMEISASGVY